MQEAQRLLLLHSALPQIDHPTQIMEGKSGQCILFNGHHSTSRLFYTAAVNQRPASDD
jgi:hypothetical protein